MNQLQWKLIGLGLLFLTTFASGYWLGHLGKPFNTLLFTIHKLIGLAAAVLLGITVFQMHQLSALSGLEITAIIVSGVCFIATIMMGGLVSIEKEMPAVIGILHKVLPYLTLLTSAATLYLLITQQH